MERGNQLQIELNDRGRYYFKDFGFVLQDLFTHLEIYGYNQNPTSIEHIRLRIKQLREAYETIPFKEIQSHPDYGLLIRVARLLKQLSSETDAFLEGILTLDEVTETGEAIVEIGSEYRVRLLSILGELRKEPGHESTGLRSVSIFDGKVWESSI